MSQKVRASTHRAAEVEMLANSLQQENDVLRFQLNDLINREKNQRLELQRLRAHRDVEVSALVNATTQKLKGEIERLKGMLEPAALSLAQAVSEKDKVLGDRGQLVAEIETMRKTIDDEEITYGGRMRSLESVMHKSTAMASSILQSVEAFQKHVLPNFKVVPTQIFNKSQKTSDSDGPTKIIDELQKLEAGVALLRVIVDAKNDTLVLIRGKLKQENVELRAELADARERPAVIEEPQAGVEKLNKSCADQVGIERNILRQEIHALQDLYSAKFKQLQSKLKAHEQAEAEHQSRYGELRQECQSLQVQLTTIEASRHQVEDNLKDETSARAQLVTETFHMRKENESLRTELEMVKVNQKFFGGQRKGRLPVEKMDLINTVNQLLSENSKLRSDKTAIEEEMRKQRRTSVLERVRDVITSRDVALCASNKVGDSELAGKLARVRLQHLGQGTTTQFALTNGNPGLSMAVANPFIRASDLESDDPSSKDSSTRNSFVHFPKPKKMSNIFEAGQTGLAQLAGLRERGITVGSVL